MRFSIPIAVLLLAGPAPMLAGQSLDELSQQVKATEMAFARTMADRDFEAFISHVADEAVFFGSTRALRGAKAIKEAWRPFFAESAPPFSWSPEIVEVLDSGTLALTSGPVLGPDGSRIGTFNSVWRRNDGTWKVVFDKGCPPCDCSEEQ